MNMLCAGIKTPASRAKTSAQCAQTIALRAKTSSTCQDKLNVQRQTQLLSWLGQEGDVDQIRSVEVEVLDADADVMRNVSLSKTSWSALMSCKASSSTGSGGIEANIQS